MSVLDRLVAPQRFQRRPRLEICREPASCYHRRTPPLSGGIHLSNLSDFPGPAQTTGLRSQPKAGIELPNLVRVARYRDGIQVIEINQNTGA